MCHMPCPRPFCSSVNTIRQTYYPEFGAFCIIVLYKKVTVCKFIETQHIFLLYYEAYCKYIIYVDVLLYILFCKIFKVVIYLYYKSPCRNSFAFNNLDTKAPHC
jgi:hypothetical protein